jgi:hypothetical protein
MLALASYDYATVRVVPRVDREEFVNAGVILFCLSRGYLAARVHLDERRLQALSPDVEVELVRQHLEAIPRICEGSATAGPIATLSRRERFHWLVAPRSTIVQVSPVHSGMCDSPERALDDLFRQLVAMSS